MEKINKKIKIEEEIENRLNDYFNISKRYFPKTKNPVANLTRVIFKKHIPEKHPCTYCRRKGVNLQRCTSCKIAFYCSRECQKNDWKRHKDVCKNERLLQKQLNKGEKHVKLYSSKHIININTGRFNPYLKNFIKHETFRIQKSKALLATQQQQVQPNQQQQNEQDIQNFFNNLQRNNRHNERNSNPDIELSEKLRKEYLSSEVDFQEFRPMNDEQVTEAISEVLNFNKKPTEKDDIVTEPITEEGYHNKIETNTNTEVTHTEETNPLEKLYEYELTDLFKNIYVHPYSGDIIRPLSKKMFFSKIINFLVYQN